MMTTTHLVTAEDWQQLAVEQAPCELIGGEFRQLLPDGPEHDTVVQRLASRLQAHVEAQQLGRIVDSTTGFLLRRNPDTVCVADVAFVPCPAVEGDGLSSLIEGAPLLAIEVVAPGQRRASVDAKAAAWLEHGSRLAWVVDPRARTIAVLRRGATERLIAADESLTGDDVLPGFRCRIDDIA